MIDIKELHIAAKERAIERIKELQDLLSNLKEGDSNIKRYTRELAINQKVSKITYSKFYNILMETTAELRDFIIQTGGPIVMPLNLGNLSIVRKNITPRILENGNATFPILWNESNKRRKEIEERGGTPYNGDTAPDGEKWLVYLTEGEFPYLIWSRSHYFPMTRCWFFTPSNGTNGFNAKLTAHRKADENNILVYSKK